MKFYEMESIKKILGLPSRAGTGQIEARISELLAKEEELEALRGKWEEREKKELTTSQWQALYKSEDWLGVWFGLGIIALAIIYFSMTGLSFKAPKFRWTTGAEFQSHASGLIPLVDRVIQQSEAKGEAAVLESASALKAAIGAQDRKAAGAAAKKLEEAAKQTKDKGLKATAGEVGKDISGQAGNLPDKVIAGDNILLAIYIALAYLVIGMIGMALMGQAVGSFISGFPVVFLISWLALFLAGNFTIHEYGLEYVLFCLFIGLAVSNFFGVPQWMMGAVRTEFYIKIGLVILGARVLFGVIMKAGFWGWCKRWR